ncbi:GNAT family N-acetyltransferase [Pinisolibacter sp.]|uniref:GNAT family N-acetyltransferase n=1 Tax=Pinisolibacter sp. TaxID=2172024 RepID=UPI002FDDD2FF
MAVLDTAQNGYTTLPPGKLAAAVVYLEQRERPTPRPDPAVSDVALERLTDADLDRYLALFAAVGEPWLWFGRRIMARDGLAAILADPAVEAYALIRGGRDLGLVELDARTPGEIELAYFGLVPDALGDGLGRWAMNRALEKAWAREPSRVFVHTCNLDHPQALAFYVRSGFVPYARAVEIADDPRLTGHLPRSAGPHVPLIEP